MAVPRWLPDSSVRTSPCHRHNCVGFSLFPHLLTWPNRCGYEVLALFFIPGLASGFQLGPDSADMLIISLTPPLWEHSAALLNEMLLTLISRHLILRGPFNSTKWTAQVLAWPRNIPWLPKLPSRYDAPAPSTCRLARPSTPLAVKTWATFRGRTCLACVPACPACLLPAGCRRWPSHAFLLLVDAADAAGAAPRHRRAPSVCFTLSSSESLAKSTPLA